MPSARLLASLSVVLFLGAACGSADGGNPSGTEPSIIDASLLEPVPVGAARDHLATAVDHATRAAACTAGAGWADDARSAAEALEAAAAEFEADPALLGDWGFTDEAAELAQQIQQAVVEVPRCEGATAETILATSGVVTGAIDRFRTATTEGILGLSSGFWLNYDYLGHTIEVGRLLDAGSTIDVLLVGDSSVKRGVDPLALTESTGLSTMNAATDGLLPSMAGPWLDELADAGVMPDTVVMGVTTWTTVVPCTDGRLTLFESFAGNRARAFAGLGEVGGVSDAERTIGTPRSAYTSPLLDRYRNSHVDEGQGLHLGNGGTGTTVQNQIDYHTQLFRNPTLCEEAAMSFEAAATELVDQGVDVVVMMMPVSDAMAELHPDGSEGHNRLFQRYHAAAAAAGARTLDLTGALEPDHFSDPAHPNEQGRAVLTEAVARELG
ncbi:MAG: hypothetical protein ACR2QE_14460 [Acidimicrobiales bacterium]